VETHPNIATSGRLWSTRTSIDLHLPRVGKYVTGDSCQVIDRCQEIDTNVKNLTIPGWRIRKVGALGRCHGLRQCVDRR
jgi:hypothetical protein